MAIIVRATDTVEPVDPTPVKVEPLSESESTRLTVTDSARLVRACLDFGVTKSEFIRSAILAKLDTTGK